MHLPPVSGRGGGGWLKILEVFAGGGVRNFYIGG